MADALPQIERPNSDVLIIRLSDYHSLDLVRLPGARKYRIVFAERLGIQKRSFVEVSFETALLVARFVASIDNPLPGHEPDASHDSAPLLPPPPDPRTHTKY